MHVTNILNVLLSNRNFTLSTLPEILYMAVVLFPD
jgi:hypothetical protein